MKKLLLSLSFIALGSAANAQWVAQNTGFSAPSRGLSEVRVVDANTVWALAYDGSGGGANVQEMTRTTDGGANWFPKLINLGDPLLEINNICPVNATTAWVSALVPTDGNGVIYKTSDGGDTWVQQNAAAFQTTGQSFLNWVHFFDANNGLATGDPVGGEFEIWRTTDGGNNWTQVPGTSIPNPLTSGAGEYGLNGGNSGVAGTFWFVTDRGRLFKTTDMGVTWTVAQAPLTSFGSTAQSGTAIFSNATNGYLLKTVGTTYTYYTTTNGGATWSAANTFTGTRRILSYIPNTSNIVATSLAAPTGTSLSTDNGATWTEVESAAQRGASGFVDATIGWAAGFSTSSTVGGIFKLNAPLANTDFASTSKFTVYPNPAYNTVNISVDNVESYNLSVTDLTGKVVMQKSFSGMENSLDISALSSGAYFFTLNADNKSETVKIIKN